jgi:hypothetical protein
LSLSNKNELWEKREMTISRGKTTTVAVALIIITVMAVSLFALPAEKQTATAQSTKQSYAFIGATPNPVGVGQEVAPYWDNSATEYRRRQL